MRPKSIKEVFPIIPSIDDVSKEQLEHAIEAFVLLAMDKSSQELKTVIEDKQEAIRIFAKKLKDEERMDAIAKVYMSLGIGVLGITYTCFKQMVKPEYQELFENAVLKFFEMTGWGEDPSGGKISTDAMLKLMQMKLDGDTGTN